MRRVVVESPGLGRMERKVDKIAQLENVIRQVREAVIFLVRYGRCSTVTVTVHAEGEGCDHE